MYYFFYFIAAIPSITLSLCILYNYKIIYIFDIDITFCCFLQTLSGVECHVVQNRDISIKIRDICIKIRDICIKIRDISILEIEISLFK